MSEPSASARLASAAQAAAALAKRHKRAVQVGVVLLVALFVALSLASSWSRLASYSWRLRWDVLALAFLFFVAQELSFALIWRALLQRMGARLGLLTSQRIYLGAEMVRYIPGNVWHVVARVLWAEREGVPKTVGFASMTLELATKILSAALVFVFSLLFWRDGRLATSGIPQGALIGAAVVGVPLLLILLHPRLLRDAMNYGLRLIKRDPVQFALTYRDLLIVTGYWLASWTLAGAGFYLLVGAIIGTLPPLGVIVVAAGIYALAWDIGFLSFITPSGVGFREAALVALLLGAGLIPAGGAGLGLATVIALVTRLLTTLAEVVCVGGAHLLATRAAQRGSSSASESA